VGVGTLDKPFLVYRARIMWLQRLVGPGVREIYGGLLESCQIDPGWDCLQANHMSSSFKTDNLICSF
jgi:hypothetical protein